MSEPSEWSDWDQSQIQDYLARIRLDGATPDNSTLLSWVEKSEQLRRKEAEVSEGKRKSQLLPCPFCGYIPYGVFGPDERGEYIIECHGDIADNACGDWHVPADSRDEAVRLWNTRIITLGATA